MNVLGDEGGEAGTFHGAIATTEEGGGEGLLEQARIDRHPEGETEFVELVFDLVEGLLAEVAVLEHLCLALHRELAHRGDVRVVETVGGADREFDLVDAHVEEFLELGVLFALGLGAVFDEDRVVVVVHEDVEVVTENGGSLEERIVRLDATVGPDLDDELVIVGALTDTGVLDGVLDASHRGEDRVDRDDADGIRRDRLIIMSSFSLKTGKYGN